jgi:hypothetical protein
MVLLKGRTPGAPSGMSATPTDLLCAGNMAASSWFCRVSINANCTVAELRTELRQTNNIQGSVLKLLQNLKRPLAAFLRRPY